MLLGETEAGSGLRRTGMREREGKYSVSRGSEEPGEGSWKEATLRIDTESRELLEVLPGTLGPREGGIQREVWLEQGLGSLHLDLWDPMNISEQENNAGHAWENHLVTMRGSNGTRPLPWSLNPPSGFAPLSESRPP